MKIFLKIITFVLITFISINSLSYSKEKIKIGLLVPLSGTHQEIGQSIVKSVRLAVNKIDNDEIEIYPKDTKADPDETLKKAKELRDDKVKVVIGPVFNKSNLYLGQIEEITFLSLTNKSINKHKNVINSGINSSSQLKTITKFQKETDLKKTIFLIPKNDFINEVENGIKNSNIKLKKTYYYDTDPTKLTKQIEKITKYQSRKKILEDEIKRLESLDDPSKENQIERLKKKDTLGKIGFDSIIISDFDETLKSITTSLLYTDVSSKRVNFITLNQWFDESLLREASTQNLYFPSINRKNYEVFKNEYKSKFKNEPNQLSFLSYDLLGLVYYLVVKNNFEIKNKMFSKKSSFKGKIGIFEIKNLKIEHRLNFYKIENNSFKKIF